MATKPRVRFSEAPEQRKKTEQQQQQSSGWSSWLFGGWKSKEETSNTPSHGHTTVQPSARVGEHHPAAHAAHSADGRTINIAEEREDEEVEDESVDKEAETFIERQRRKLEIERLKSMKRLESMLNRGL